jgi:cyclopropane-fatty-acyl-phospholipid synthase
VKTNSIALLPKHRITHLVRNPSFAKRVLFNRLKLIKRGVLRVHDQGERYEFGINDNAKNSNNSSNLVVDVFIHDAQFYSDVIFGGSVGAGEAYMSGYWSTPNLTNVMRLFAANLTALDSLDAQQSWISQGLLKLFHWFNRNTKEGARHNIAAHYDLGNDFFSLFLDESMMYSSAIYPSPEASLSEAAQYKLQSVCKKLQLNKEDHLLEIGTGWGGMAIYAAQHYGCRVTTTTISKEQRDYAIAQVAAAGLCDRVTVLFDDYRELTGQFSKLVSIEMIEAVGHEHYDRYFETCSGLLAANGLMLIQAISIPDQRYEQAHKSVDFIQRYIFPGGSLPSIAVLSDAISRKTDMNILHLEDIGDHYAQTLKHWREIFMARLDEVRAQGFDERFIRMWEFYLSYCEGGFYERSIGTLQMLLAKPDYRREYFA